VADFTMTLTLGEFERQLQPLLTGWTAEPQAHGWHLWRPERSVIISCWQRPALRLGVLLLPCLDVSIAFSGNADQEADFIEDFLRYFRRGGG